MIVAGRAARALLAMLAAMPAAYAKDACQGPWSVAYPADRPPLSMVHEGQPAGVLATYLQALQQHDPSMRARPVPAAALSADQLPVGTQAILGWPRAQVPAGWVSSHSYLQVPQVIVRLRGARPVLGLGDLQGATVASPERQPLARHLREQAPYALLLPPAPVDKAFDLLVEGRVDAVVVNVAEASAALQFYGDVLRVAAPAGFSDALVMATVPECAARLARHAPLLQEPSPAAQAEALARWTPLQAQARPPPQRALRWLVPLLLAAMALALVHAYGFWRLHREGLQRQRLEQRLLDVTASLPAVVFRARRSSSGVYSVPHIAGDVHALFGVSVDTARIDHAQLMAAVHPDDRARVLAHVDAAALVRGPIDVSFRSRGRRGWRWVRSRAQPMAVRGEQTGDMEWTGYWMDVTDAHDRARALEDARQEAEQGALAKTHFLATMSHQIRTPMSTLLGLLEQLGSTALDGRQQQALCSLDEAATMLRQILDDVLDSQRLQPQAAALAPQPTDLRALLLGVQRLLAPLAASKGLYLRCEVDPALQPGSWVDALRLRQILMNLVGNALKFTLDGGVELRVQVLPQASPQQGDGQQVRLQVADTGVGISPARQRAVFSAYTQADASTTRRFGGSGLGLAICHELAATMGGQLQLRSRVGQGSTLWLDLWLPACTPPAALPVPARPGPSQRLPSVDVLVAEDHPTNRQLLVNRLRGHGLRVQAVADGAQAWKAWQAQSFALVVTDCQMPGMDGFALARAIRADPRPGAARVPIIALSASVLASTRQACVDAGMDRFLAKPVAAHDLHAAVAELLATPLQQGTTVSAGQ